MRIELCCGLGLLAARVAVGEKTFQLSKALLPSGAARKFCEGMGWEFASLGKSAKKYIKRADKVVWVSRIKRRSIPRGVVVLVKKSSECCAIDKDYKECSSSICNRRAPVLCSLKVQ